jgi:aminopeptidase N
LILDTRDLEIRGVETPREGGPAQPVPYQLGRRDPILGTPLRIELPEDANRVTIRYRPSRQAHALQWVEPAGTAGGRHPFLFSQSQSIHARSWIPCQDSPGVRVTYDATIELSDPALKAVMAAEGPLPARDFHPERPRYRFVMDQPIPSYLIALAVGDLQFQNMGPRTGVWAEPSVLEAAARELADTERMLEAAESLYGPYRWTRYDLLILPPSFPFGGMENPRLTFATPTILAGDRSLVALVAHELAHSWSGNLVTNATWDHFWLNEGFTTYLERRIVEAVFGPDRAAMERLLGRQELRKTLAALPARDQILNVDLKGRDPDDGFTQVPYEKGAAFLETLEARFGRDRVDAFLKDYFTRYAFQSVTTADLERDLRERLFPPTGTEPVDLHLWLHRPGLPPDAPVPVSDRFQKIDDLMRSWRDGKTPLNAFPVADWSTQEWLHFLNALPERLPNHVLAELDAAYKLTDRGNAEIAVAWLLIVIRNQYQPAQARLESFLKTVGRRKFLAPLYAELSRTPQGKARARALFEQARPAYHPIAAQAIAEMLR